MKFFSWIRSFFKAPEPPLQDHLQFGAWGEDAAASFLKQRGFRILDRNFRQPRVKGEIDLIAWDKETLVFVEVKTRRSKNVRVAESAVNWTRRRTLIRVARWYRRKKKLERVYWRYDVVSVYPKEGGDPEIEYFPDAFREKRPGF